jgi:hypothetical protein
VVVPPHAEIMAPTITEVIFETISLRAMRREPG